jgi:Holliday junction resolvase
MTTLSHRTGGARHRRKGARIEREIVERHKALGIHAERCPLSGASQFRGSAHDVDIYLFGRDEAPAVAEVKGRKNGAGFATLERWLADYDCLFLRRNNADPLVVLPWRTWADIIERVRREMRTPLQAEVAHEA